MEIDGKLHLFIINHLSNKNPNEDIRACTIEVKDYATGARAACSVIALGAQPCEHAQAGNGD
jgi:hypothetical protein